jgi:hypothetical protein
MSALFLLFVTGCASSRPPLVSEDLAPAAYNASGIYEQVIDLSERLGTTSGSPDSVRVFHPALAFDGDAQGQHSYWNSGGFPVQWIEVDLQRKVQLAEIRLVVAQSPDGATHHEIWVSDDPIRDDLSGARRIHEHEGMTKDHDILEARIMEDVSARFVQVRTLVSPSWVAWMEIEVRGVEEK